MRWLIFSMFLVFVVGCNQSNETKSEEQTSDQKAFTDSVCYCSHLILDELYNHFYHENNNRKQPFTGICRDSFPDGTLQLEKHLKEGKNHGIYKKFYKDGTLKIWKRFDKNYEVEGKNFFPSGALKYHAKYKAGKLQKVIYSTPTDSTLLE